MRRSPVICKQLPRRKLCVIMGGTCLLTVVFVSYTYMSLRSDMSGQDILSSQARRLSQTAPTHSRLEPFGGENLSSQQSEDLSPPQSEGLSLQQSEDLSPPQSKSLSLQQSEDLSPPQSEGLSQQQNVELPPPRTEERPPPQYEELRLPNQQQSNDVATTNQSNNETLTTQRLRNVLMDHLSNLRTKFQHSANQMRETHQEPQNIVNEAPEKRKNAGVRQLLVHLDLKGAPPKVSFLQWLIQMVASLGATGLLIEWEDKFPYSGPLAGVVADNAYSLQQVHQILETTRKYNLTVMPLVQTFGHLEFVLKTPTYEHLREDPKTPQALCPSRNESVGLVNQLIDQMMAVHTDSKYLHIGSDEVFVLGKCDLCRRRSHSHLILEHVTRTARYVRERHHAIPVMWEDMLRNVDTALMRKYGTEHLVEPMFWWYTPDVRRYVAPGVWQRAEKLYSWVWGAGAYKGAFGSELFVAPVDRHVQNNLDWTDLLNEESSRIKAGGVSGLVLTGWSRYDHFATLCELLPAAVPSLAFSIAAVRHEALDQTATSAAMRALHCTGHQPVPPAELNMPYLFGQMADCRFPGRDFYMFTQSYNQTLHTVRDMFTKLETRQLSAWLGEYNQRHNFTSVLHAAEQERILDQHKFMLLRLLPRAYATITQIYDQDIALEWIEHRIYGLLDKFDRWEETFKQLKQLKTFPVRPLRQYPKQLLAYMDRHVPGWNRSQVRGVVKSNRSIHKPLSHLQHNTIQ